MGIPYFSCIENPGELFVFLALGLICSCMAVISYIGLAEINQYNETKKGLALIGLFGFIVYVVLSWIFNGDSFEWSAAFGRWLQGK